MKLATIGAMAVNLALSGCAVVTAQPITRPAMRSAPPAAKTDAVPQPARGQAWVPGFYEPAFGAWVWRPGRLVDSKPGYEVVEASYVEESGEFRVRLPHWARQRFAGRK